MKISLSLVGQDVLKVLSVVTLVAKFAEPIVDLTNPGIAQIYNISADEGVAAIQAFLGGQQAPPPAPASAPVAAPAPAPVVAAPAAAVVEAPTVAHVADPAPPVVTGPGLHNVVPA